MSKFSDIFKKVLPTIISTIIPGTNNLTKAAIAAAATKASGGSDKDILASGIGAYAAGKYGMPSSTGTPPPINPSFLSAKEGIMAGIKKFDSLMSQAELDGDPALVNELSKGRAALQDQLADINNQITIAASAPTTTGGIPSTSGNIFADLFSGGGADNKGSFGKIGDIAGGITNNFPGGIGGLAALGVLGKSVYDDYKRREGGIADTPQVSMDSLGRYQLANALGTGGTREEFGLSPAPVSLDFDAMNRTVAAAGGGLISRQYFKKGGIAELDMREGGESEGPGTGTSDDIPAMLSDGEFVMTAAATKGAGAYDLNKTKKGIELIKTKNSDRERGVTNMRELMNIFEAV